MCEDNKWDEENKKIKKYKVVAATTTVVVVDVDGVAFRGVPVKRDHSKQDHILLVKIGKYIGFCVYRGSYLIWFPVVLMLLLLSSSTPREDHYLRGAI